MQNIKNLCGTEFSSWAERFGVSPQVARRVFARVFAHDEDWERATEVRGVPRDAREALRREAMAPSLHVRSRMAAPDGFLKYVFDLDDGAAIEAVRIPLLAPRYSLCLSTQLGCAMGCEFCETGRMGFRRHLETWEIIEQAMCIRREADRPIRGIVFMGMGEPLANYDNVIRAARILSDPSGFAISQKAITISTVGLVPAIRRYTREGHKYRLAVSLTVASPDKRRQLLPIEQRYPLEELLDALREYSLSRRQRVMVQVVLIRGFNTGPEDVAALRQALHGIPVRLSIIEVNDARGIFLPPLPEELRQFRDALADWGQPVVRRYSGGKDARAGCGMLAT